MKINKLLLTTIGVTLLSACQTTPSYRGVKYTLEKKETGSLTVITPKDMFQISSIDQKDSVFFLSLEGCSACREAHESISNFCLMNSCEIYEVKFDQVTFSEDYSNSEASYPDTDYYWLYLSTTYVDGDDGHYALPRPEDDKNSLTFPMMYFYKYGGVGYKTTSNFIDNLRTKVEVK